MNRLIPACVALLLLALALPAADPPKEARVKPINLEKLNTPADEDDVFVASNGLSLYYASNADKKFDILQSQRGSAADAWPAGKLPEGYLRTEVDDRSIFLTPEGTYPQYVYYATKKDKTAKNFDIYVAVRQFEGAGFTAPTPVNSVCTPDDEMHPWLTTDGKHLYFSRKTKEGWRVFVASRDKATGAAGFGEPKLVEELPPGFHHVTIKKDGSEMYLQGPLENDRWGLFRFTRVGKEWTKPEELTDLNDPEGKVGDRSPALFWDQKRTSWLLYFASDRPGGKGGMDLWVVSTDQLKKK